MTEMFIGVDVGGTDVKAGLVSSSGELVRTRIFGTHPEKGHRDLFARIAGEAGRLGEGCPVCGAGIGLPGQVDQEKGIFIEGPNLPGFINVPAARELSRMLNVPVRVDNDANCAALAEFSVGAAGEYSSGMLVTLGTGVGGGIILNNEIVHGFSGGAGEFGHTIIKCDGPVCSCGRRGCVEAFAGTTAILRILDEKLKTNGSSILHEVPEEARTPKAVFEAAEKGDDTAREVFAEAGTYLGIGIANVINLLNLPVVVVGGGVARAGDYILEPARKSFYRHALKANSQHVKIVPAVLGNRAGMVGAAHLALRKSISNLKKEY